MFLPIIIQSEFQQSGGACPKNPERRFISALDSSEIVLINRKSRLFRQPGGGQFSIISVILAFIQDFFLQFYVFSTYLS